MPIDTPSFEELSPTGGANLDEKLAAEHFLGKTPSEAEQLFRENAIYYAGDLMWMGDKAFAFYFPAFCRFLESAHADGESDALNSLTSLMLFRTEHEPKSILDVNKTALSINNYCLEHYPKFGVQEDTYGDLRTKLLQLKEGVLGGNQY